MINLRTISKSQAHTQTMTETSVQFQKDRDKTVGGVTNKRYNVPVSILYKSIASRYRPVSYPDGPITAGYRFIKNASWDTVRGRGTTHR